MNLRIPAPLLAICFLPLASLSWAQSVTTDPVGFFQVDVNASSDGRIGLGLHRTPAITTTVASAAGNVVGLNTTLTADQFVYNDGTQDDRFYLFVKDGSLEGRWYEILDNGTGDVTVDQGASANDVQTQGLTAGASVCVIPFWTLNTMFPDGNGIDISSDPFNPSGFVLLNTSNATGINIAPNKFFLYYDGSQGGSAGWYDNGNLAGGLQDDFPIAPDSFVVVRNLGTSKEITITGAVPMDKASYEIISGPQQQDNYVTNPFPVPISLDETKLFESGAVQASPDPFNPTDLVLLFNSAATGINVAPSGFYLYYDGSQGGSAGWYDNANLAGGVIGTQKLIQPGDGIVIRKAAGVSAVINWTADAPYSP